jgi:hypothetical protein
MWTATLVVALSLMTLAGLLAVGLFGSARAAVAPVEDFLPAPVLAVLQTNDQLHYGVHLMLGRALGLCPCTRSLAAAQYSKATWHARTPRQMALVTSARPHTVESAVRDLIQIGAAGVRHVADAVL